MNTTFIDLIPKYSKILPCCTRTPNGEIFWANKYEDKKNTYNPAKDLILACWKRNVYDLTFEKIKDCPLVIDLGANTGAFSMFACSLDPSVKVIAVEPNPTNFLTLLKNIHENKMEDRIFPLCVGMYKIKTKYDITNNLTGSNIRFDAMCFEKKGKFAVNLITLNDLFNDYKIYGCGFLKVDIEGSEWDMFEAVDSKILSRCDYIGIEHHTDSSNHALIDKLTKKLSITHDISYIKGAFIMAEKRRDNEVRMYE